MKENYSNKFNDLQFIKGLNYARGILMGLKESKK
jgi:hypothetical protein